MSWLTVSILAVTAWSVVAVGVAMLCAAAGAADRAEADREPARLAVDAPPDPDPVALREASLSLLTTLRAHDPATAQHSDRVARLCRTTGMALGLGVREVEDLVVAAALHDLGKLRVPAEILRKPGRLTAEEWDVMAGHPAWGAEMLEVRPPLQRFARTVGSHHERTDGEGYPHGLRREGTPLPARIIAVCDAYDAMTSNRSYGAPLSREAALAELERCADSQFDPEVVASLCAVLKPAKARRQLQALLSEDRALTRRTRFPRSAPGRLAERHSGSSA